MTSDLSNPLFSNHNFEKIRKSSHSLGMEKSIYFQSCPRAVLSLLPGHKIVLRDLD